MEEWDPQRITMVSVPSRRVSMSLWTSDDIALPGSSDTRYWNSSNTMTVSASLQHPAMVFRQEYMVPNGPSFEPVNSPRTSAMYSS